MQASEEVKRVRLQHREWGWGRLPRKDKSQRKREVSLSRWGRRVGRHPDQTVWTKLINEIRCHILGVAKHFPQMVQWGAAYKIEK